MDPDVETVAFPSVGSLERTSRVVFCFWSSTLLEPEWTRNGGRYVPLVEEVMAALT